MTPSAPQSRARGDEVVFETGEANYGRKAGGYGGTAEVVDGFDVEDAVFAVDEGPMKAGGGEDAGNFLGSKVSKIGAELEAALTQGLFDGINAHPLIVSLH